MIFVFNNFLFLAKVFEYILFSQWDPAKILKWNFIGYARQNLFLIENDLPSYQHFLNFWYNFILGNLWPQNSSLFPPLEKLYLRKIHFEFLKITTKIASIAKIIVY